MSTAANATLTIRVARETDRADIQEIGNQTWGGTDYLPFVFDSWLADTEGSFYVAQIDDRVIGTAKLSKVGEGEWWLEGLRVHPEFQGQGIGRHLHNTAIEQAVRVGSGMMRLSTDEDNSPTLRYARETGFVHLRDYLLYEVGAYQHQFGADAFRALTVEDVPEMQALLARSTAFAYAQRSTFGRRWKATIITEARLREWATEHALYGWYSKQKPQQLSGVVMIGEESTIPALRTQMDVMYIDAVQGHLAQMARAVRGLAARLGYDRLRHMLPVQPDRLVAIEQGGWRRPKDNHGRAVLYGRSLDHASE